jgi:hypothetical protein
MTHYCAAGNQPRLRFDPAKSRPDTLVFAFAGGTNLDPAKDMHIHGAVLRLMAADRLEADWQGYVHGKPADTTHLYLRRKTS